MKLKEALSIYNILGELRVTKMDVSDVVKIVKARKEIKPHADGWSVFMEELQAKFAPQREGLSEKELMEVNRKMDEAMKPELEQEVEIVVEKLGNEAIATLLCENGCNARELMSALEPMM